MTTINLFLSYHARCFKSLLENSVKLISNQIQWKAVDWHIPHSLLCPQVLSAFSAFSLLFDHCHRLIFSPPSSPHHPPSGQWPPGPAWPMVFNWTSIHLRICQSKQSMSYYIPEADLAAHSQSTKYSLRHQNN